MGPSRRHDLRALAGALLTLLGACSAPGEARVERWGELRAVLREGRTEGRVELARAERPGAVGLGALAGLAGEVVVLDGRATVSRAASPTLLEPPRRPAPGERATFLALATPATWSESSLGAVASLAELETAVAERLAALDLDPREPRPFVVAGRVRALDYHVLNGACPFATPPPPAERRPFRGALAEAQVLLVGFFAEGQEGLLTHHGQRSHVHVLHGLAGHVDELALEAGASLRLGLD